MANKRLHGGDSVTVLDTANGRRRVGIVKSVEYGTVAGERDQQQVVEVWLPRFKTTMRFTNGRTGRERFQLEGWS
jgi:hypothetical protein